MSSRNGIVQYNTENEQFISYYQTDGLQGNNFIMRSSFKDANGNLYFGGTHGLNYFLPKDMNKKASNAKLYVNSIEILNQPAKSILPEQFLNGTENVNQLKLSSDQSSFSFQFSALDNILDSYFHYAYRLKGFNNEWIVPKSDRIATFTNIPFGNYTFEVKAGSKKGTWDIPAKQIEIKITPPWWHTPIAYIIYFLIVGFAAYTFMVWIQMKNKLVAEELKHDRDNELYALKMNFFTKMSHEIQTPLTLIMGPIEDMLRRAENNKNLLLKQRLTMITNNANRLSRIAMELTSMRNKELGKLKLHTRQNDLIQDLEQIAISFEEQALFKQIHFSQQFPVDSLKIWYDKDKVEHILYNLLANAFKFTPRQGTVDLSIHVLPETKKSTDFNYRFRPWNSSG